VIALDKVSKAFDTLKVLHEVSLHVAADEIVGIVGPSGSGKTTILKLITGLLVPDAATVTVPAGTIGYAFQEPRLLPWRTALDNVAAPLRARGASKAEARAAAARWLERVELAGFERYHPAELSGGMAQRVSLARAFAVEPDLLLMDEPFANVDVDLKGSLMSILGSIIKERRTTMVYVTHELPEALRLADRIVELTPDHTLRELDLADRAAVGREWLARSLGDLAASARGADGGPESGGAATPEAAGPGR
jgi:NitT/TauT family transport system ATP-binding protein